MNCFSVFLCLTVKLAEMQISLTNAIGGAPKII